MAVKTVYILYKFFAESEILGVSLSMVGPGDSAAAKAFPFIPIDGSSASMNIKIPMPPSQCVKDRQ